MEKLNVKTKCEPIRRCGLNRKKINKQGNSFAMSNLAFFQSITMISISCFIRLAAVG